MAYKLSCDIVRDLIPLVKDGIAGHDSEEAVLEHIKTCEECRALMGEYDIPKVSDSEKLFIKLKGKITAFSAFLMFAAMFLGLSLTFGEDMFYNSFIMPIVGFLGYIVFKLKAVYSVPLILTGLNISMSIISIIRGLENGTTFSVLTTAIMWSVIYSLFSMVGVAIGALYHYALKKEDK